MSTYLVREIDTKKALGIFWGQNPEHLFDLIDEHTNPHYFEYAVSGTGAVIFMGDMPDWPKPFSENEDEDFRFTNAACNSDLDDQMLGETRLRWKTFPPERF